MSDIYAQILEELPEGKRPTWTDHILSTSNGLYTWTAYPRIGYRKCGIHDAHAHIRCAAEDFVREWCKKHRYLVAMSELHDDIHVLCYDGWSKCIIGHGPDLPTALLAAVRYCKAHA